jgi:uncharacterized membrane protein
VIAAIVWVGVSFYFILLENVLLPPVEADQEDGVEGERYWLHGGAFYFFRKYGTGPKTLPANVQWHPQWYAYMTWVSGFALLIVVYYWNAGSYLIGPGAPVGSAAAIAISVGVLAGGFLLYEAACRLLIGRDLALAVVLAGVVAGTAYGVDQVFSPRGTYIQIGALMGTWMAANVVFVFERAHHKQYRAKHEGGTVSPAVVRKSIQRGLHNTYLTLPVLFAMLGNHFSFLTGSEHPVEGLLVFLLLGVAIRHFFIRRQQGRILWAIPVAAVVVTGLVAYWLEPSEAPAKANPAAVVQGKRVFATAGCTSCHTLAGAGSTATVGPDLDRARPDAELVIERVTNGKGVMPAFGGTLSRAQIEAVAAYVSSVAGR